jgi:Kef-type K+ transport system membrane component KefB
MPTVSFDGFLLVAVGAFAAPLWLGLSPARRVPSVVLEIVAGIIIGPSGLGWVKVDVPTSILSLLGLAFLLFLAGLEVELDRLKGRLLLVVGASFLLPFGLALLIGYGLATGSLVKSPLLVAMILCATSLGVVSPVLEDAGISASKVGQLVLAGATLADFGPILLLSLLFSREATSTGTNLFLLGSFVLLALVFALVVLGVERSMQFAPVLVNLQDPTAQLRVRGAFVLLVAFVALAQRLGLEVILGAFLAGVLLRRVDQHSMRTHPELRQKLEAIGFGVFLPLFFVVTGIQFDLSALFARTSTIALPPQFLVALLIVHGVPAMLYRPRVGSRRFVVAALVPSVSLPVIVAASHIGTELGLLSRATVAALITAGLLSVVLFPIMALTRLRRGEGKSSPTAEQG